MPEPRIPIVRRAVGHISPRSAAQVDAHIHAHEEAIRRRSSARHVVALTAAEVDARIEAHAHVRHTKRPKLSGA